MRSDQVKSPLPGKQQPFGRSYPEGRRFKSCPAIHGNAWKRRARNTVKMVGVMGKGIAHQFKNAFPAALDHQLSDDGTLAVTVEAHLCRNRSRRLEPTWCCRRIARHAPNGMLRTPTDVSSRQSFLPAPCSHRMSTACNPRDSRFHLVRVRVERVGVAQLRTRYAFSIGLSRSAASKVAAVASASLPSAAPWRSERKVISFIPVRAARSCKVSTHVATSG